MPIFNVAENVNKYEIVFLLSIGATECGGLVAHVP